MDNPFQLILDRLNELEAKISSMPTGSAIPAPEIINSDEVCKRLDLSESTLIKWRQKKKIPFIQHDGVIRYNWPTVVQYLESKQKSK